MSFQNARTEIAYGALRQAIIEQALVPGTKLPEDEIGGQFGMSRTLVRVVLARLRAEGLVETGSKRTATVARPTLEEVREIFEVRRSLEIDAVRLVAERWRPAYGAELEGLVRQEDAAKAQKNERVSIRLAGEFHIRLAEMSGNRLLTRYLSELVSRCSLILNLYGRPHSSECATNEHHDIIAALRSGNAARAAQLMDEHVGAVEQRALLPSRADNESELSQVLSSYAEALEANAKVVTPLTKLNSRSRS